MHMTHLIQFDRAEYGTRIEMNILYPSGSRCSNPDVHRNHKISLATDYAIVFDVGLGLKFHSINRTLLRARIFMSQLKNTWKLQ